MKTGHSSYPKLHIGIEIHKRSWKIHNGSDLFLGKSFIMRPDPESLKKHVSKHFHDYQITCLQSRLL